MTADLKLLKVDAAIARLQRNVDDSGPSPSKTTQMDKLLDDRQTRLAEMHRENVNAFSIHTFSSS